MWLDVLLALAVVVVPLVLAWIALARREGQRDAQAQPRSQPVSKSKR